MIDCNYCLTSYSNTSDDYISNVSFNTINNPSGSTTYSDYTSMSTNISAGNSYNVVVDITINGSWVQHCWVWIDWNRDCDFDDAGEGYDLGQTPGTSGTHTLSTNIVVPVDASFGSTRMRISELWNTDPMPCTSSTYGEAEDYTVNITGTALDLKAFLEGPFSSSEMNTSLNALGYIPMNQPFNVSPWNYFGAESIGTIPNSNVVDWCLIELRETPGDVSTATPGTIIAKQAGFLLKNGSIVGIDGSSLLRFNATITDNLFAIVYHRNHQGIISAYTLSLTGNVYSYDFSSGIGQVYGGQNGHKEITTGIWGMFSGDANADGEIDNKDKNDNWKVQMGLSGYYNGDFDMNGQVNMDDKSNKWKPNTGSCSFIVK